jgi:hypothetical protein
VSNFLAVATVTGAIVQLLQASVGSDVAGAVVTTTRPEPPGGPAGPAVNVFLYQVSPNAAWRNEDLPTRRADGTIVHRPHVALDLHYLLTFHGDDLRLEPQRLLGSVARTLQATPVLTKGLVADAIRAQSAILGTSDLAAQAESVRITPAPLSLEELSKLWSVFFQTTYALSAAYTCQTVIIESDVVPSDALPVRRRAFATLPFIEPALDSVAPALVVAGTPLVLSGANLGGPLVEVDFGGRRVRPDQATNERIAVTPPPDLPAGISGVRVVQRVKPDPQATAPIEIPSETVPFVLRPTIAKTPKFTLKNLAGGGRTVTLACSVAPPLGPAQDATLLLGQTQPPAGTQPFSYAIALPARDPASAPLSDLVFPCDRVAPGTYLVRLRVDGAESVLGVDDKTGRYASPAATLK